MLSFVGCEKLIYDPDPVSQESAVYLSVNIRAAQPKSGLRSSINLDDDTHEDRVHSLAMLIFNSSDGSRVGSVHVNNNLSSGVATRAFTVELIAGREYDFYFVANMPGMETVLNETNIPDRDAMDNFLSVIDRELNTDLYSGATVDLGFPMARVYKKQLVSSGGTVYQPAPFKPKQLNTEEYSVIANEAGNGTVDREYVELIRVVAKLEVELGGELPDSDIAVKNIYFRNANRHFSLVEFTSAPTTYFNSNASDVPLVKKNDNTYIYYMPEAINEGGVSWSGTGTNQPINYFTIETTNGTTYDVPIITFSQGDGTVADIQEDYLQKATGQEAGFTPNYDIYRNRHYKYVVRNLEQIEIIYEVEEWNVVGKSLYMGYGYNVEVDEEGNVTITNTIDDCMPHLVRLVALGEATFAAGDGVSSDFKTVEYGYESEDDPGYDEVKAAAGYSEGFKINKEGITGAYMEVYYNDVLVKTFTR